MSGLLVANYQRRGLRIALVALLLVAGLAFGLWHAALYTLEQQIRAALGPEAEFRSIQIRWPGVVAVDDLRMRAPKGWPAPETLRAERIEVTPDLRSMLSPRIVVRRVVVDGAYLSLRRDRRGKLELLPSLIARAQVQPEGSKSPAPELSLDSIEIENASLDMFDASIPGKPVHLRLEAVRASLRDLHFPELSERSALEIAGIIKGAQRDGRLEIKGWVELSTRESDLSVVLDNVDLVTLEPYLITASETGVERGGLNLNLRSRIHQRRLTAPGTLVLTDLKLKSGGGFSGTFMGMPRKAVIGALKSGSDQISLSFTLEGDLDNPKFSLNETLSVRVAVGMAQSLGVGLADIARDVGTLGGRTLEATGSALGKLFGSDDE